jgi:Fe-Mn family superoxide dismutase
VIDEPVPSPADLPPRFAEAVQQAAGAVAARHRGDLADAEALLRAIGDDAERAAAFFALAELALALLCDSTRQSWDDCMQDLTLSVAAAVSGSTGSR